jgi:hypothetical protein
LVLYGALAEAVGRESGLAVGYWRNVGPDTVWKWRKALGVGATTTGTSRLRHEWGVEPAQLENMAKAKARAGDPERRAKISAARKDKPRPPHVGRAVAEAHRGTHHSAQTRARMRETHRHRGTRPPGASRPWTAEEDALVRTLSAAEVATRTRPHYTFDRKAYRQATARLRCVIDR